MVLQRFGQCMEISRGKVRYRDFLTLDKAGLGIRAEHVLVAETTVEHASHVGSISSIEISKLNWSELEHPIIGSERKRFFDRAMMIEQSAVGNLDPFGGARRTRGVDDIWPDSPENAQSAAGAVSEV